MSSNKKNVIYDAAKWTLQAGYVQYQDARCKANDPNSHYNPETGRCEPGA
jgi:hypothetical protein